MTTVSIAPTLGAFYQGFDDGGLPLNAGLVYTYSAGTTTPQATYTTSAGNVANANPIVLDADGRTPYEVWLTQGVSYRFDLKDSAGNLLKTYDNIQGPLDYSQLFTTGTVTLLGSMLIPDTLYMSANASAYATAYSSQSSIITANSGAGTLGTIQATRFSDSAVASSFIFVKGRGTAAAGTIVASGDVLGNLIWNGAVSSSAVGTFAVIRAEVDGTPGSSNDYPGRLVFLTTPNASGTATQALLIDNAQDALFAGYVRSSSPTKGIGYSTGAGGAQTQQTDKSTTVVSNTATTLITLNNANLAAGTIVAFTFTNSSIASTDHPIATHVSAGTLGAYTVTVTPGSGTSTVTLRNNTAGGLAEAIVIRVTNIKAVSA